MPSPPRGITMSGDVGKALTQRKQYVIAPFQRPKLQVTDKSTPEEVARAVIRLNEDVEDLRKDFYSSPLVAGILFKDVLIASGGSVYLTHKLLRVVRYAAINWVSGGPSPFLYRPSANVTDKNTLQLSNSGDDVTVDILVYPDA